MQRLSEVAGPADLADAALQGAKGMRRRRGALTALAAVAAVAALTVPFTMRGTPPAAAPGIGIDLPVGAAASPPVAGECETAPMVNPTTKEVAAGDWPQYVRTVLDLLPDRDDYVVQNAYDLCNPGQPDISNAYTVINLGHQREYGHLTVNLFVHETSPWVPGSCADLNVIAAAGLQPRDVVFCEDGGGASPLLYGLSYAGTSLTVGAVYADHRAVVMERDAAASVISVEQLKQVVSSQELLSLVPVTDGPLPTTAARGPEVKASSAPTR
ncbi:hypothetical protein Cco03nite_03810 [Catellatospora coxensis]|uniref:Uncharacterized protein n=2 Tax=Catellatospora coxensis TaxID=310354 RepID=A0A8J3KV05_9ACTN|nr:hypothetical protein Cco03nite_03810 [Catellatospora coxensis]